MGFRFCGAKDGADPIVREMTIAASQTLVRGQMVTLASGAVRAAATEDTAFVGPALANVVTADGKVNVITNPGAIYEVEDASARVAGEVVQLTSNGLGIQTPADDEADFIVWSDSAAGEPTRVVFNDNNAFKGG